MFLSNNTVEYLTCLAMLILTTTSMYHLVNLCSTSKKIKRQICKTAVWLPSFILSNVIKMTTHVAHYSGLLNFMKLIYTSMLPLLDGMTHTFITGSRLVSNHYAAHRKRRRKGRLTRRDLWIFMAMTSTTKIANTLRKSPVICQFDSDSFQIGLDTYSSRCVSNKRNHFTTLKPTPSKFGSLKGIGGNASIEGIGTLRWIIEDDYGQSHQLIIPNSLYVPKSPKCLLSPQHLAQVSPSEQRNTTHLEMRHDRGILHWGPNGKFRRTGMINKMSNTPNIYSAPVCHSFQKYSKLANIECNMCETEQVCYPAHVISDDESVESKEPSSSQHDESPIITIRPENEDNITTPSQEKVFSDHQDENLNEFLTHQESTNVHVIESDEEDLSATTPYAELLRWHYRLGHMSFHKLKAMAKLGILPRRLANVENPKCASCYFGKMTKRPWRTSVQPRRILPATKPGQCVSVDQMESSTLGFVAQLKGRLTKRRYRVATVFVDHFSDLSYVHLQSSTTSQETVEAKLAFEAYARDHGVTVEHYHADNGRFADTLFLNSVKENKQTISYCSVNAHHQNGRAEKRIRDLREAGRTQLLHAVSRWPQAVTVQLWPYAVRTANDIRNRMVDKRDGTSPLERFSSLSIASNPKHFHTFGCPVYALDNRLASNSKIPPWQSRARLGINLGPSPRHARSCALVLDPRTGLVSPQYHASFDEFFETTRSSARNNPNSSWMHIAGFTTDSPRPQASEGVPTPPGANLTTRSSAVSNTLSSQSQRENVLDDNVRHMQQNENNNLVEDNFSTQSTFFPQDNFVPTNITLDETANIEENQPDNVNATVTQNAQQPHVRRSTRVRKPSQRFLESAASGTYDAFMTSIEDPSSYYDALHQDDYKMQDDMVDPIAFLAKTDADTMYYHQAMAAHDKNEFLNAMVKEYNDHAKRGHWEVVHKNTIPQGTKVLDSIWSMKRKRDIITRRIIKWKARLNVHGGQQVHGVNYFETYSPVVHWFSVRLLYIIALLNKWHTRQIDFVLAYPQADIECEMFMKLPLGLKVPGASRATHALKLKKNIYGQKQAGRVWNKHLCKGLENIGFRPSKVDECVYYRGNVIFCFFVDDGIFYSPDTEAVDTAIADLLNEEKAGTKFEIENRGDVSDYLGINFDTKPDGRVFLTQPHLIQQIIDDVNLPTHQRDRATPAASSRILQRDQDGIDFDNTFDYRSIIGKLNYLEKGTRPDIAYAVHQLARFSSNPKKSHADAVIHLVKYLKATKDKGIILDPNQDKSFEVFADADFSGNWFRRTAEHDASTAKSRTGYIITIFGCPIIWQSKLQTQIALSTTEAEYIALSQSLRDTIPIMNLLKEIQEKGFDQTYIKPKVHCKAFEDNLGALELSKVPKMRPRTKHINLVYHHFRDHVRSGEVSVHPISTDNQLADLLTKPLDQNVFQRLRRKLLHW